MKPKLTTIPEHPHPPRLRRAPGVTVERHDIGTDVPPPRKRRLSKALVLSILAHVVILLGASYWVIARHSDAPPPVVEPEGDPFPLMQRTAPETSPAESPVAKNSTPLAMRALPQPDLPQPVLAEFLTHTDVLSVEMPEPMFQESPPVAAVAMALPTVSKTAERILIKQKTKPGGGSMKSGKSERKSAAANASPGASGPSGGGSFALGQLDGKPRLLHHPSANFPAELLSQGAASGTVVLDVEIDESGAVRVLGTVSSTHPALVAEAKRIAAGSSFTPPRHDGRNVKAHMKWPIVIRKS